MSISARKDHRYHHGDLRAALLQAAGEIIREEGVDALSLRRLADRTGVSRTAPYHHFRDKHALLCDLARDGFEQLQQLMEQMPLRPGPSLAEDLNRFVLGYLRFAQDHPDRYELMFGRSIWTQGEPSPELKAVAYRTFRHYAEQLREALPLPATDSRRALRIAQASWASLHGLCRLLLDGIYVDATDLEDVCSESVRLLLTGLRS